MIIASLVIIMLVGLVSFYFRLKAFNSLPKIQKEAYSSFKEIKDGLSLKELNELLGKRGKKVFNQNKYRWTFGDTIIVKKDNQIVSFENFSNNIDNVRNYSFKIGSAYIEIEDRQGTFINPVAVGLN